VALDSHETNELPRWRHCSQFTVAPDDASAADDASTADDVKRSRQQLPYEWLDASSQVSGRKHLDRVPFSSLA
jgi:hypothetical protein